MEYPTILTITDRKIDVDTLIAKITLPTTGAVVIFTGTVRGVTTHGETHHTTCLEYEVYQSMAERKMNQVADEIRKKWPTVQGIVIVQRTGRLDIGTPTTIIACSAPHRDTGVFDATRYGIDRLKEIVPIWKKEIDNAEAKWVEGHYHPKPGE